MTRLEALRVADAVCRLAEQIRDQRVIEARSFRHTWTEVAAVVGVTRQSAHRRWRGLDGHADALAAERQRQYRPRPLPAAAPAMQPPLSDEGDWNAWRPGLEG